MGESIKTYKGFNKDMTCRDFQYEEGKEYTGSEDNTEYDRNNQSAWVLNGAKMVQVDGENIKPDTWYKIENGEIAEVSE